MAKKRPKQQALSPPKQGYQAAALASMRVPNARESKDPASPFGQYIPTYTESFSGFPGDTAKRLIGVLRYLAQFDEDAANTLRHLQAAVNTEIRYEFDGGARAKKLAEAEIWAWQARVFSGGFDGLVNNQVREAFVSGVLSIEWVPQRNRKGIREAVPVPRETVGVRRDADDNPVYEQTLTGEPVLLNPLTYRYVPIETEVGNLHGLPIALPAVEALDRKRSLLNAEQRIITLKEKLALVMASLPMPSPDSLGFSSTEDEGFAEAAGQLLGAYVDLLVETGDKLGVYAGWETEDGKPNIQAVPTDQNVTGLQEIVKGNQHRAWNGLGIPPFLAGEMGSTNYALAGAVLPASYNLADTVQKAVISQLEYGAQLHLRLVGIPATVYVKFAPRDSAFAKEEAEARKTNAETDTLLYNLLGDAYLPTLAANWDVSEDDLKAFLENKPEPEPDPVPPTDQEVNKEADDAA